MLPPLVLKQHPFWKVAIEISAKMCPSTSFESDHSIKYCPDNQHEKYSMMCPWKIFYDVSMKNILWCVHEKYSMIFPWQIFYDISMKNILWYVHDKYSMNVCPWKILNNISIKHILWYVHNNFVKSFESAHSIKYSTGVAEPMGKKFHIITCNGAVCQKKGKHCFAVLNCEFYSGSFLTQLCLTEIVSAGTKAFFRREKPLLLRLCRLLGFIRVGAMY